MAVGAWKKKEKKKKDPNPTSSKNREDTMKKGQEGLGSPEMS